MTSVDQTPPPSRSFSPAGGQVESRIGPLGLNAQGLPDQATIDRLYEERDFQRACQAYLWALPIPLETDPHQFLPSISELQEPQLLRRNRNRRRRRGMQGQHAPAVAADADQNARRATNGRHRMLPTATALR